MSHIDPLGVFALETEPGDPSDDPAASGVEDDVADRASALEPDADADTDAAPGDQDDAAPEPPLWRTSTGDILHLPPHVLNQLVLWLWRRRRRRPRPRPGPRARRGWPGRRVRRRPSRQARRAALRGVGRLARGARRVGTLRHRPSGRRFSVFRSGSGRGATRLIARRGRGRRFEIVAIEPEIGGPPAGFSDELEVLSARSRGAWRQVSGTRYRVRGAQVSIDWHGPLTVRNAARKYGAGVYIVYRDRKPIYVGQTNSFARRWTGRLDVLLDLGIDPTPFTVWVGTLKQLDTQKVLPELLRQDVEHVLVRYLARAIRPSGARLTNRRPAEALLANTSGIVIRNSSKSAPFLPQRIALAAGQQLEVAGL